MGRSDAHQFSLLIWSPNPGVSITVSFILTPPSSMTGEESRKDLMIPLPQDRLLCVGVYDSCCGNDDGLPFPRPQKQGRDCLCLFQSRGFEPGSPTSQMSALTTRLLASLMGQGLSLPLSKIWKGLFHLNVELNLEFWFSSQPL